MVIEPWHQGLPRKDKIKLLNAIKKVLNAIKKCTIWQGGLTPKQTNAIVHFKHYSLENGSILGSTTN